ncbi:MAG: hypothetical protein K2L22_10600, partial [Muribaculaceae bacterium]|nr:hypothetical protein [Muribaculaceae bacterium]
NIFKKNLQIQKIFSNFATQTRKFMTRLHQNIVQQQSQQQNLNNVQVRLSVFSHRTSPVMII